MEETRYGYARVSTEEQSLARQQSALGAAECRSDHRGVQSGVKARHRLDQLLVGLKAADELVAIGLDRLGRSTGEAILLMDDLIRRGVALRVLALPSLDITTNDGRMMMQMVGSFAEFERAMIRERTSAGLAAARAEGRVGGRRKKLDAAKRREIAESVITGRKSAADMARLYGSSQPTVSRIVAQHRMNAT